MLFIFSTPELIRNLWQLKTAVFLHWCLIRGVPFIKCFVVQDPWHKLAVYFTVLTILTHVEVNKEQDYLYCFHTFFG
jgi:hypothetical protein